MDAMETVEDGDEPGVATSGPGSPKAAPSRNRLSMSVINFWLDALLLVILFVLGWISAILRLVFPAPTSADGWKLWGRSFDDWSDFQFGCICVLGLAVVVHVMLHWNWVCSVVAAQILRTRRRIDDSTQTIYGVGLLIVLLHLILAGVIAAMYSVHKPPM